MTVTKERFCAWLAIFGILFQGCAASADKLLVKKDLESVKQIRVVRYEFAGYGKETTGAKAATIAIMAPFILFGAIGGGLGGALAGSVSSSMVRSAGKEMQSKYNLPDFAELVHRAFAEKLPKSLPDWPEFIVEAGAMSEDSQKPSGYVLTIKAVAGVSEGSGLQTNTDAQLMDPTQNVLWNKRASYKSSDSKRPSTIEALEADNGKLLHEEIALAVKQTAAALIDHLHNRETKQTGEAREEEK